MNVLVIYSVLAVLVAAAASVLTDRFGSRPGVAAVLAGPLWPVVVIGGVQIAVWVTVAKSARAIAARRPQAGPTVAAEMA